MSTRATYTFKGTEWQPDVSFYIHYDGYHEGAAAYFYAALMLPLDRDNRGGLAASFIRANGLAEFTGGHDTHGDTEFRYTVEGNGPGAKLTVRARSGDWSGGGDWPLSFSGLLAEFVWQNQGMIEEFSPFKGVKVGYRETWLNEPQAQALLNKSIETLTIWAAKATPRKAAVNEGNWRSQCREAAALIAAFPGLKIPAKVTYERMHFNAKPTTHTHRVLKLTRDQVAGEVAKLTKEAA